MVKGLVDDSPPVPQDLHEIVSAARENLNLTEDEIARLLGVETAVLDDCLDQPAAAGPEFRDRIHKLWDTAVLMKEVFPDRDAGLLEQDFDPGADGPPRKQDLVDIGACDYHISAVLCPFGSR
jgi:hypothetical protein